MNRLFVAGCSILLLCRLASATISNGVFKNSSPYLPTGNGSVSGMVTCGGTYTAVTIMALLYNVAAGSWVRAVPLKEDCAYTISAIPPGTYRVVAVIDRDGDKNPDEMTVGDSVLAFIDAEAYTGIDLQFAEKPTGAGSISGRLSGIDNLPEGLVVTVAALPVDTTRQQSDRLDEMAYMMAYRSTVQQSGTYSIGNLPDGVYYVVGVAEENNAATGELREIAYGVHGEFLLAGEGEFPFGPAQVIVQGGAIIPDITIIMVMRNEYDRMQVVSAERLRIPAVFALQSTRMDQSNGSICLQFAVAEEAGVSFSLIDLAGRSIAEMAPKHFPPGYHTVNWTISAANAAVVADGTYIVSMTILGTCFRAEHIVKIVR